jgi:flagellar biosynthesis protein FlhA
MADYGARIKEPEQLGEIVRAAIARTVTRQYVDHENKLACITLDPAVERDLIEGLHVTAQGTNLVIDPAVQVRFLDKLRHEVDGAMAQGFQAVLICSTQLRLPLRRLLERHVPNLNVLAYNEIAAKADVEFVGQVRAA